MSDVYKRQGYYTLAIFNLNGQLVKNIYSKFFEKGDHKVAWDGRNNAGQKVVSGMYICRLYTNNNFLDTKMMLLK